MQGGTGRDQGEGVSESHHVDVVYQVVDAVYKRQARVMSPTTEDRLIQAGRQLLEDAGISAVTVREVARRCGVSHGAPRRHFPTLALLLAAIAEMCFDELHHHLTNAKGGLKETARAYVA